MKNFYSTTKKQKNKVALITGGISGIGRAIALSLAKNGFQVVINYKNNLSRKDILTTTAKLKKEGADFLLLKADITKEKEVEQMVRKIIEKYKKLDVLINNAGINKTQSFTNLSFIDYDLITATNLKGAITVTKFCLPIIKKSGCGRIIFISSSNAFIGSPSRFTYVVSKSGILGVVKALTLELSPDILVNAVIPGYIKTKMTKFSKKKLEEKIKKIPLRRLGEADEVANLVSFLVSDLNTYITGQSIHIDGGLYLS
jgi:3-oxoacyl-[acyl-carrier protein] reductase